WNIERASAGVDYRLGGRTTVGGGAADEKVTWATANIGEFLNRNSKSVSAYYRQQLTVLTTLVAEVTASHDRFELAPDRNTNTMRAEVGFDLKSHALVDGTARIGVRQFDPVGGGLERFQGAVATVDVGYTLFTSTRLSVRTGRDVQYSFEELYPY